MSKAEEIINLQKREEGKQSNFRVLWQDTANLIFPRESDITVTRFPGTRRTVHIADDTAVIDSKVMSDGLLSAMIPAGEPFFKLNVSPDNLGGQSEDFENYLSVAAEKLHIALFESNFMLQMGETMRSLVVFGTGNIYSEWTIGGLNFRDWDVGLYQMLENSKGLVDTMILKFPYTARQAVQEFGNNAGKSISEAFSNEKTKENPFDIIHIVRPRKNRNIQLTDALNMPFESVYVAVKDKTTIDEGGFNEFPYHTPRWAKTSSEIYGRGVGTEILPQVKILNQQMNDLIECSNKWNNPPMEAMDNFEGEINTTPGAINWTTEIGSAKAIDEGIRGNFPITKEIIEMQREVVHTAFYKNAFFPLTDLKGDRRVTLEIRERIIEALRRVGQPVYRTQTELFKPLIIRSLNLLIRNGQIPRPPAGLQTYEIEYLGLMANALSSGQAKGFQQWVGIGAEMEDTFPGTKDNISIDEGYRDLGRSLGVKTEHINTSEEVEAIRLARAKQLAEQKALEIAQAAAQGYSQTKDAAEKGSPAAELQEAISG
jgi:hypothetical protein